MFCFFVYKVDEYVVVYLEWNKQLDDEIVKNNWNMEYQLFYVYICINFFFLLFKFVEIY